MSSSSSERRKPYPFDLIELKWQAVWDEKRTFHAPNPGEKNFDPAKPKYYVLDMFPYPSGAGLHVGHPEGYTATDIIARYKRMCGYNVLHPMGWDAFGLPAEQYAIKTGQHPAVTTAQNVARFKEQLKKIGFAYDWEREVNTTDPGYFKWTQWIFLKLYNSYFDPIQKKAKPISLLEDALSDIPQCYDEWKGDTFLEDMHRSIMTFSDAERPRTKKNQILLERLAWVSEMPVNWCPALGTVLANEEVIDGKSEVGGHPVVRRPMKQWILRITRYAQRLIDELDGLDWPESIKLLQKNWIGRSEGAEVHFELASSGYSSPNPKTVPLITVFTTRPDTLFGATYMVMAPEHGLVDAITTEEQWPVVREYREHAARKSDLERTELSKEKTGVFTGAFAVNPVNGERIPIWIADYVLLGYGTGAIMAVPAHDERDWEFAQKYSLPVREVVSPEPPSRLTGEGTTPCDMPPLECFSGEGFAINSPIINGLPTVEAKRKITEWLEQNGFGKKTINYKLRDWLFSRQRYWGEPFPIVWECEPDGHRKHRALDESELPLTPPPLDDFKPTGTGEPPLAKAKDWIRYSETATRETNTMPQWAGSCWYYLRFCDPKNDARFVGETAEHYWMGSKTDVSGTAEPKTWAKTVAPTSGHPGGSGRTFVNTSANPSELTNKIAGALLDSSETTKTDVPGAPNQLKTPAASVTSAPNSTETVKTSAGSSVASSPPKPGGVDLYVGGTEHAVLHLLYARFWHKVLFDLGFVSKPEPFQKLVNQGMILGEDGRKMSKRWGNVIDPLDVIAEHGADAFRCYEMFMGPLEQMKPWSMTGVEGVSRFLARVWRLMMEENQAGEWMLSSDVQDIEPDKAQQKIIHATIKKVGEDIETLSFNTAISEMMKFVNAFVNADAKPLSALRTLLILLNPFAPHLTEELWQRLSEKFSGSDFDGLVANQTWPSYDESFLIEDEIEIALQVNGKVRDKLTIKKEAPNEEIEKAALASSRIQEFITGKTVRKVIVVPGKLVNVVVS